VSVTRKTINTIEKGRFVPSTYLALKLAKVFRVPVEELFQLDPEFVPEE
jgi:putative transcriptional regulator